MSSLLVREGQALALRKRRCSLGSRGTGPRATDKAVLVGFARDRPSRYGDREHARDRPSRYGEGEPRWDREGQALALRIKSGPRPMAEVP